MKRYGLILAIALTFPLVSHAAPQLLGALRNVDSNEFFWYSDPISGHRFYVSSAADLNVVMGIVSVGISVNDLKKIAPDLPPEELLTWQADSDGDGIPNDLEAPYGTNSTIADTDGDGYNDGTEIRSGYSAVAGKGVRYVINETFSNSLRGRLFRQADASGAIWYVTPDRARRVLLGTIDDAFKTLLAMAPATMPGDLNTLSVSQKSPLWLQVPEGYRAEIAATDFLLPRALAWDPAGHLAVSNFSKDGNITVLADDNNDGTFDRRAKILDHLAMPHGIVFAKDRVYVARELAIEYWPYDAKAMKVTGAAVKIFNLPPGSEAFPGKGHQTRTLQLGQDGKLYVAIGSNCDSCLGFDKDRAVIKRMDLDGTNVETVARGLRNTVFFTQNPANGDWYGNEMGQDSLGDNYPPDEINRLVIGRHYGWPYCVADQKAAPINPKPEGCVTTTAPEWTYPAHSAPLGLAFVPQNFSGTEEGNMLSALHGSTVRSSRIGYKIMAIEFDKTTRRPIGAHDLITGFLRGQAIVGRPASMTFSSSGSLYITDDFDRLIYRISPIKK